MWRGGLLLLRHATPLTRRNVVYFCAAAYTQIGEGHSWAGVMSTATGLIFFGDDANFFEAADAKTGKSLWHFNTGQSLHASPMSYAVNGKQYVAIASGSDLFSFALPR